MHSILDHSQYVYSVIVQDSDSGNIYDISEAIESITWQTYRIASQPGSLEVVIKEGLIESGVVISPGSFVRFGVNGVDYFYGNVEEVEKLCDALEGTVYRLKAYDHLMLLKNTLSLYRPKGMTASTFFAEAMTVFDTKIRSLGDPGIRWAVREPSFTGLDSHYFVMQTLYSMFKDTMTAAHVAERGESQYMIRDNLGTLEWRELSALRKNYVLGDSGYTSSYTYSNTLEGTFNAIRVFRDNENTGMRDNWQKYHSENIRRWRYREFTLEAEEHMTDAEIADMIDLYMAAKNRTHRSLQMSCVGINGIEAGDGIRCAISGAEAVNDHNIWIEECKHVYTLQGHDMALTLFI